MMNSPHNGNGHGPTVDFDYATIDCSELAEIDLNSQFWAAQGELLGDILRWLVTPNSLGGIGARCVLLAFYLRPEMVNKCRLKDISRMRGAPSPAALSKAMIEFQRRYDLKPSHYQRLLWMRDRYRRSALIVHQERAKSKSNGLTIN